MAVANDKKYKTQEVLNRVFDENNNRLDTSASLSLEATGLATEAKQDDIITAIEGITVDPPVGGATEAKQDTQITHLATIAGDTTDIETAVELIDDTVYTDGSGTVTKGIAVLGQDGTNPQAIKTDSSGELQVDVLTMPTVAVTQSGTWDEVGINDSGNSITVDNGGTFAVQSTNQSGDNTIGRVKLTDGTDVADILDLSNSNPLTVAVVDSSGDQISSFGGGTQYTQGDEDSSITGTAMMFEATTNTLDVVSDSTPLPINLISSNPITVEDGSGSLTVDNAGLSALNGAISGTEVQVDVLTMPTVTVNAHAVTNAGTFAVQESGSALTALQLIDDVVYTDDTSTHSTGTSKGVGIMAAATPTDGSVSANDIGMVAMTTDRKLHVSVQDAIPAGTNAIGKLAANSGVDIGDVDITSIAAGDNNIGNVDIVSGTITTVSTLTGGGIAHDSADSGNPIKVGAKAFSPDGTTPGTAVAENDRSDLKTDLDGRLFVNPRSARQLHKHLDGSSAYTDESVAADPGDGFQVIITSIIASTGSATAMNFFLEEGSTKIFGPIYLEATAGRGFVSGPIYLPVTASTAVTLTSSAAIAQSFDIDYFIQAV